MVSVILTARDPFFRGINIMKRLVLLHTILLVSCSGRLAQNSGPDIIEVAESFENKQKIYLSQFVSDIDYIPLETGSHSILSDHPVIKAGKFIVTRNRGLNQILCVFNRNGSYLHEIGKIGRGPEEYFTAAPNFYNIYNEDIYTMDETNRKIIVFNSDGTYIETFNAPEWDEQSIVGGKNYGYIQGFLPGDIFASFTNNFNGGVRTKLVLFTQDSIIRIFPNYLHWGNPGRNKNLAFNFTNFIHWDNNLYFKEVFNDTVFKVTTDTLLPRMIFDLGKYGLPYEKQNKIISPEGHFQNEYFMITDMDENTGYFFFQLWFQNKLWTSFFDKRSKKTTICDLTRDSISGLIDDLNGFITIVPADFTVDNEMVSILSPDQIIEWKKNNPDKVGQISKKLPWLKTYSELSNPVVVIGKCKMY